MSAYEIITKKVIEAIENEAVLPWRRPWKKYGTGHTFPVNLVSGKEYQGVNVFLLSMQGFESPYWVTYKQAAKLGGWAKKGEKGTPILYWSVFEAKDVNGEKEKRAFVKFSYVFNAEQCENLPVPQQPDQSSQMPVMSEIERCERIIDGYKGGPVIVEREPQAYYSPRLDKVNMPVKSSFTKLEEFFSTLFHELGHSTGHPSRLDRKGISDKAMFGSDTYSKEELIAELTASFLCAEAGIENETFKNSVAYLQGWLKALKGNSRLLIEAASQAQKSADLILNRKKESKGSES